MAWKVPSKPGDVDPSIAEAKRKLRKYFYGKTLDSTSTYTVEFGVALVQFQINRNEQIAKGKVVGKPGMAVDGALDWRVKKNLEIIAVSHVDEVISRALVKKPEAITWAEPEETPTPRAGEGAVVGTVLPH